MIAMLFSLAYLFLVGLAVKAMLSAGLTMQAVYGVSAVVLLVSGLVLLKTATSWAERRYAELEV
jgi:hypothetical protein